MANTILQQSSLELVQQIEAELLENPALDVIEDAPCSGDCIDPQACPYCSQRFQQSFRDSPAELDAYVEGGVDADDDYDPVGNLEAELTLQDHLCGLLRAAVDDHDYQIG